MSNRLKNLEWATAKENTQHSIRTKLRIQRNLNGDVIQLFPSAAEAGRITKINQNQISKCANGGAWNKAKTSFHRSNTVNGFRWIWKHDYKQKNIA